MNRQSVTFETKCYEKDWEILLKTDRLESIIARNRFDFQERILYINNVLEPEKVRDFAERLKARGVITDHVLVEDFADEALTFFDLNRDSFKGGYYYSIQELVGLYRCQTDFLLHFSGDSILDGSFPWVEQGIELLEHDERVRVVNCVWNRKHEEARANAFEDNAEYWFGYGFSDQCYLVRTADFRAPIYDESHPASERFPGYGGELFEKRVDSWMRNHGYLLATYKHGSYLHKNYPRNKLLRTAGRLLGVYG